ncbi:hypothetical protein BDV93DRAFT_611777 [Ceratobasidium sp. AG-I]|nr:hypothetical protein BDV93DRAFT_611777 [Ceratobasidium sp. AG-I]
MVNLKAGNPVEDPSSTEASPECKINKADARSEFLFKLVKLVGLSECLGDRVFRESRSKQNSPDLVVIEHGPLCSPVTVRLTGSELEISMSEDSARSSSDSSSPVPDHESALLGGVSRPRMTRRLSKTSGARRRRNKSTRNTSQCKANTAPLSSAARALTPIPEISSISELNSLSPDNFVNEDAKMEDDSIRARRVIALARAQLQLSRPASYFRKLERSRNQMMMLPGELEESLAAQTTGRRADSLVRKGSQQSTTRDVETTSGAAQRSVPTVVTLTAAKEMSSQQTMVRESFHSYSASVSTVDLLNDGGAPPQGLYKAGDRPPCPPPSIPLPKLPSQSSPISRGLPITPAPSDLRRSEGAYKGLPTEYRNDNEALQHIDMLMRRLLNSQPSRKRSLPNLHARTIRRENDSVRTTGALDSDSDMSPNDFGMRPRAASVSQSTPTRQVGYHSQWAVRSRPDGALLTPAPTPPMPTPARTVASQSEPEVVMAISAPARSATARGSTIPRPTLSNSTSGYVRRQPQQPTASSLSSSPNSDVKRHAQLREKHLDITTLHTSLPQSDSTQSRPVETRPGVTIPSSLRKRVHRDVPVPIGTAQNVLQRPVRSTYNYV